MPWADTETGEAGRQRYLSTLREVTARAQELFDFRIKGLTKFHKVRYHAMFGHLAIMKFCKDRHVDPEVFNLLLIMDMYEVFYKSDLIAWGVIRSSGEMPPHVKYLYSCQYVIRQTGKHKVSYLYLSIKGKQLVKEYDQYLEDFIKKVLNSDKKRGNIQAKYNKLSRDAKGVNLRRS